MATTKHHPHATLLGPIRVGPVTAPNRVFFAPTSVGYADDGALTAASLQHYGRRAQGGAGAVMTEHFAISEEGRQHMRQPGAWETRHTAGIAALGEEIHRHGALAIAQISHAGRYAGPWDQYEERRRVAPSAVPFPLLTGTVTPAEMTADEIDRAVEDFGRATTRFVDAGWDGVEIHAGSGFLISEFLSPRMNRREDDYGGKLENRSRLCLEVVRACRAAAGSRAAVGINLMADELMDGGWTLDDALALSPLLEREAVDFIRPTIGTFESLRAPGNEGLMQRKAFHREQTRALGDVVGVPIMANGGLHEPDDVEHALVSGEGAIVALSRPLLADPDWVAKVRDLRVGEIRHCPCSPPRCLMTQLTGAICEVWPEQACRRGFYGYDELPTPQMPAARAMPVSEPPRTSSEFA